VIKESERNERLGGTDPKKVNHRNKEQNGFLSQYLALASRGRVPCWRWMVLTLARMLTQCCATASCGGERRGETRGIKILVAHAARPGSVSAHNSGQSVDPTMTNAPRRFTTRFAGFMHENLLMLSLSRYKVRDGMKASKELLSSLVPQSSLSVQG